MYEKFVKKMHRGSRIKNFNVVEVKNYRTASSLLSTLNAMNNLLVGACRESHQKYQFVV